MSKSHTVGEVLDEVFRITQPSDPSNIYHGRTYDGIRRNLLSRNMIEMRSREITMNVVVIMRDILSRYTSRDGMNIAGALEFLDTVQAASAQPGLIGGIGHRIMSSIQTLMARYAQATTVTERVV